MSKWKNTLQNLDMGARQVANANAGPGVMPSTAVPPRDPKVPFTVKEAYGQGYADIAFYANRVGLTPEQLVQQQFARSGSKSTFADYLKQQHAALEGTHV